MHACRCVCWVVLLEQRDGGPGGGQDQVCTSGFAWGLLLLLIGGVLVFGLMYVSSAPVVLIACFVRVRGCAEPTAVRGVVVAVPHGAVPPGLDCVRVVADRDDPVRSCGHALLATSRGEDDDESHREGAVCVRPVLFEVLPDDRGSGDSQHVHLCKWCGFVRA